MVITLKPPVLTISHTRGMHVHTHTRTSAHTHVHIHHLLPPSDVTRKHQFHTSVGKSVAGVFYISLHGSLEGGGRCLLKCFMCGLRQNTMCGSCKCVLQRVFTVLLVIPGNG